MFLHLPDTDLAVWTCGNTTLGPWIRPEGRFLHEDGYDLIPLENSPLLVYHTVKNEWREVQPLPDYDLYGKVFVAKGKFHVITRTGIDVLDGETNTWQRLHSHPTQYLPEGTHEGKVDDVIAVDGGSLIQLLSTTLVRCLLQANPLFSFTVMGSVAIGKNSCGSKTLRFQKISLSSVLFSFEWKA